MLWITFSQFPWLYDENWAHYQTYLDLTGTIDVLGAKHSVLIGVDYYLRDFEQGFRGGVTLTQNIFDLKQDIFDFQAFKALGVNEFYPSREEWFGVYFQDQITLWDSLHILGGGRYDWASSKSGFSTISSDAAELTGSTNRRFSPRVGILYQPWPWLSLYGNYVESLGANNGGRAVGGKPFDPQTGEQYEAGVKTEFLDGQLSATLAYFHLTKKNSLTADLNNPGFSIAIGEAQSEGVEFDLIGRVTDKLSLITTYAFTDARITKNNDGSVGRELPQVPDHSGSFWAKYEPSSCINSVV